MIAIIWEFRVKPEQRVPFERLHGADGEWSALARRSRAYLGSAFLRNVGPAERYVLIEYWSEMIVYERHLADFTDEIEHLERARRDMVEEALPLGVYQALDVPDRFGPTWSQRDGR